MQNILLVLYMGKRGNTSKKMKRSSNKAPLPGMPGNPLMFGNNDSGATANIVGGNPGDRGRKIKMNYFQRILSTIHEYVGSLNNSKYFAGIVMIMLNLGGKVVSVNFSKSTQEYFKINVGKQFFIFSMAWMGTRDIYTALVLTAVFTILSEHLFNEDSKYCIVPEKYKMLKKQIDTNDDGVISDEELAAAMKVLEKAKVASKKGKTPAEPR